MDLSYVALVIGVALSIAPGLHYDLLRARTGVQGGDPSRLRLNRIVIAGLLVSAATLTVLSLISLIYPEFSFGFNGLTENASSPGVGIWSAFCFVSVSLTLSALSATIMTHLEFHPRYAPGTARAPQALRRRASRTAEDLEVEVKLTDGRTYRGVLGSHGLPDRYLLLTEPIFDIGDHGKPLPMDALHWPWLALSESTIVSVLARPVDDGFVEGKAQLVSNSQRQPRHSNPHKGIIGQLKLLLHACYRSRFDPYALIKLLGGQVAFMTLMSVLARAFTGLV